MESVSLGGRVCFAGLPRMGGNKSPFVGVRCPWNTGVRGSSAFSGLPSPAGGAVPSRGTASASASTSSARLEVQQIDDELSKRPLELDPAGYFVIFLDSRERLITVQHFRNVIDSRGLACDPETGDVIPCDGTYKPTPNLVFRGISAKQLSVEIIENEHSKGPLLTMTNHANYLGRELQKAEAALFGGWEYIQD